MQSRNLFPSSKLGHLKRSIHLFQYLSLPSYLPLPVVFYLVLDTQNDQGILSLLLYHEPRLRPPHPKSHITPLQAPTVPFAFLENIALYSPVPGPGLSPWHSTMILNREHFLREGLGWKVHSPVTGCWKLDWVRKSNALEALRGMVEEFSTIVSREKF